MKLVTFQVSTPVGKFARVGAYFNDTIVDLNMAYTRMLFDQKEAQSYRMAQAGVPSSSSIMVEGTPAWAIRYDWASF